MKANPVNSVVGVAQTGSANEARNCPSKSNSATIETSEVSLNRPMKLMIVGYCFGIRSERRLCDEVHLNLAYRWFCRLGLDGDVPDHSTFSKNRHGRFRESDLLRKLFETVVACCMKEGIVGGEAFAVDASMIVADAHLR